MNINVLIDSIVAQTTVLIAQLATSAGTRAPLAHTANQVFVDLVRELKSQGLGNKVISDMFGMALRTYHNKVRRLSESSTFRGKSLWEAVLQHVQGQETVLRADVLKRFSHDEEAVVRGVLSDLVDGGLLFRTGRGDHTAYRAAPDTGDLGEGDDGQERLKNLIWIAIYRSGPLDAAELSKIVPATGPQLQELLGKLVEEGHATRVDGSGGAGSPRFHCDECVIPLGASAGWEAGVWDHYQAMVTAICNKLARGRTRAAPDDWIGGSTFSFDVWDGHPEFHDVANFLASVRAQADGLRARVEAHNAQHAAASGHRTFTAYVGQTVIEASRHEDEGGEGPGGHDTDEGDER